MWQMVFANVSVKGWIIGPYVQGFFYGPQEVLVLSPLLTILPYWGERTKTS